MGAREADAFMARFNRDREIETEMTPLKQRLESLEAQLSAPRRGYYAGERLTAAYVAVHADVRRILSRLKAGHFGDQNAEKLQTVEAFLDRKARQ